MTPSPRGRDALATGLTLLTGRALTSSELQERLQRRGYNSKQIAAAGERLAELGYLDDRRTAAAWAESAVRTRGLGPRRLSEGLSRRGLSREIIEETVDGLFGPGEESRLASVALAKWEQARGLAADDPRRAAAFAHLRRRGFSGAAARSALFKVREFE